MTAVRLSDHEGGVRVFALDRPPANAIDESLLTDLTAAVQAARDDDAVRTVVVTGTGAFFCGGFDFAGPRRDDAARRHMQNLYRESHLALLTLPKPTVAMVNGHATAGGFVLALACDYRLGVAGDWKCGLNEVAVGAGFPKVATEIVLLRLPHARAAELMLGAALYPATEAIRLGLVDELVALDTFEATVLRRAARLAGFPKESYAHTKASLLGDVVARVRAETPAQAEAAAAIWTAPESRAARARQREKLGIRRRA
jgi:enoyl-CoA hydratase/carnithine racemase